MIIMSRCTIKISICVRYRSAEEMFSLFMAIAFTVESFRAIHYSKLSLLFAGFARNFRFALFIGALFMRHAVQARSWNLLAESNR